MAGVDVAVTIGCPHCHIDVAVAISTQPPPSGAWAQPRSHTCVRLGNHCTRDCVPQAAPDSVAVGLYVLNREPSGRLLILCGSLDTCGDVDNRLGGTLPRGGWVTDEAVARLQNVIQMNESWQFGSGIQDASSPFSVPYSPLLSPNAYMEDHLKNKNWLEKEWVALCVYQAKPNSSLVAQREENVPKNRSPAVLTYDHSRILLKSENSHSNLDYINASPIMDHHLGNPAYIATQGPLPATVTNFWQMVWESSCVVIVMLTPLSENGVRQCYHSWPDKDSNLYHVYQVNLVSKHIWCEDFLIRSFYLKILQSNEMRTMTQFHFLSWNDQGVPSSVRSLLDFCRKVNKSYRGRSCPIIVHCSNSAGRSSTYVLIDMVLNKMAKGTKEINIAATLEHLRDQRPGMVQTKEQFEFALMAMAEEVNAIFRALLQ
ncbi:receptor-type tyrosine-protein phosphatase N2-like [Meles meles]|uniref:receptor-type tyrosine-protein phosphatase N2-like n=1 Tax=Meles meles TaxID=9662 RepID=UPI001E69AE1F|nr:receptor-type tyrosine-protein phosphatase N2-like [Meles meles]